MKEEDGDDGGGEEEEEEEEEEGGGGGGDDVLYIILFFAALQIDNALFPFISITRYKTSLQCLLPNCAASETADFYSAHNFYRHTLLLLLLLCVLSYISTEFPAYYFFVASQFFSVIHFTCAL